MNNFRMKCEYFGYYIIKLYILFYLTFCLAGFFWCHSGAGDMEEYIVSSLPQVTSLGSPLSLYEHPRKEGLLITAGNARNCCSSLGPYLYCSDCDGRDVLFMLSTWPPWYHEQGSGESPNPQLGLLWNYPNRQKGTSLLPGMGGSPYSPCLVLPGRDENPCFPLAFDPIPSRGVEVPSYTWWR